jgi:hypothetical protein
MRKCLSASPVKAGNNPLGLHDARTVPVESNWTPVFQRIRQFHPYSWAFCRKLVAVLSEIRPIKPKKGRIREFLR